MSTDRKPSASGDDDSFVVSRSTMSFSRRSSPTPQRATQPVVPEPAVVEASVPEPATEVFDPLASFRATYLASSTRDISGLRIADSSPDIIGAEFYSINLPSGFAFYDFNTLRARTVRGVTQVKFTKAARESGLRFAGEAVSSCLSGVDAMQLHLQDFYYVMYWLRLASYTKFDFTHVSVCTSASHLERVTKKELPPESLTTINILRNSSIRETEFNAKPLLDMDLSACTRHRVSLGFPIFLDAVESSEMEEQTLVDNGLPTDGVERDELLDYASLLNRQIHGSLLDRMKLVMELHADVLQELDEARQYMTDFGVREFINVTCKGCGAEQRSEIVVSAHSFLRPAA